MHIFLGSSSALSARGAQSTGQAVGRCQWAALGMAQEPLRLMGQSVFRDLSSSVCLQPLLSLSHTKPIRAHFLSILTLCPHPQHLHISVLLLAAFWHTSPLSVMLQRATDLVRHIRSSSNSSWSCSFGSYKFVVVLFWRALALDCIVHLNVTSWLMWILHYHNEFHYWQCILGLKALSTPPSLLQYCTVLQLINL